MLDKEQEKGNEHRVIRLTDWHYQETKIGKGRGGVLHQRNGTAEDIVCVGTDRIKLMTNQTFIKRVYEAVYGKEKWEKNYDIKTLKINKIVFKKALSLSLAPEHI
jgi:hypothetical protein